MLYSERLKEIRKRLKISQTELANKLGVNYSTVSRIEREKFYPSYELIQKVDMLCEEIKIDYGKQMETILYPEQSNDVYNDLSSIITEARLTASKTVNYLLIQRNWQLGKRISIELLNNNKPEYGVSFIKELSKKLTNEFGYGFEQRNLYYYLDFYKKFPSILNTMYENALLSWTHYRILLQVENDNERTWYANEANNEAWSARTLQRNISTQYFYRILNSSNREIVHNEMTKENKINELNKQDFIKDPMILEFLGLSENNYFLESELENAIINHLQQFLIELGKGYAFVARQQRIHTEKQEYYIDLVFYNYILKCFVLIDLKTDKISYQDVGQMDMYIKMYDELKKGSTDNPTIGIVLTTETDDDIARYSCLHDNDQMYASKYKLILPTPDQLRIEIEKQKLHFEHTRELRKEIK